MGACLGTNLDAHATDEPPQEQESYLSSLACSLAPSLVEQHFVRTAVQALARPPRRAYGRDALGPNRTGREGLIVTREDVVLTNRRGLRIHASFWSTAKTWAKTGATYLEPRPAIVYIHGAGSSRAEAADAPLSIACAIGASLLAVDTTAQGRSDGDVGSLGGDYEIADVAACVDWLRKEAKIDHILLWGRSAGAVACLGYAREAEMNDAPVRGVVADSAFANLSDACEGLFERRAPALPRAFRRRVLDAAFVEVKRVAGWDPRERRVDEVCKKLAMTPVLFAGAHEDDLVPVKHAETLHAATRRGELVLFPGTHNSPRPVQALNSFRSFARRRLMAGSAFARRAFGDVSNSSLRIATYSPATP